MDMKTFLQNQIRAAMDYKWCKGVELRHDPGPEAINEWITKNAEKYRKDYNSCVDKLVEATLDAVEKRVKDETCPICNKERLRRINRIVIEEFTQVWFLEMMKPNHDQHVEEV